MKGQNMRLAIRQEGRMVNAYLARPDNLGGALHIGSISTGVLNMRPALFEQFKQLMTDAMIATVEVGCGATVLGTREEPVPEHEKAGNA